MSHNSFSSKFRKIQLCFFLPFVFILTSVILQFTTNICSAADTIWVEDSLPSGATGYTKKGDVWNWISNTPTPYSGTSSHQSILKAGFHQHHFMGATDTLAINVWDTLIAYVYLDPADPPSTVMLQWYDGRWNHRAYWGADNIKVGRKRAASKRYMGALPPVGEWVRLQVPASEVGLEGRVVNGMAFTLYDGRAAWDRAGKSGLTNAPILNTIADITVDEGDTITLSPTATDADGDTLTFDFSGWMTSNHYTTDFTDAGTYTVTVTVSDGILTDSQDVTITVVDVNINNAPVLSPITDISVNEGEIVVLTPTATDADGDTLTFSYSGWMTSNHYATDFTDAGTYTVTVTVSDGILTDSQDVTITVVDVNINNAPVLSPITDISVNEGEIVVLTPTATDADGDTLTFNYSGWMTSSHYTTDFTDSGTYTVTVTVSDGILEDSQDVTITVVDVNINNAPVLSPITNISVNEGEIVVLTPTATDADGDTLTFNYSGWMTSSHYTTDFTDSGTYTVTITVSDGILVDMQDVSITVLNTNRAPVLGPISDITVNEGDVITLSPTATDADGDTLAFNYSGWMTSNRYISNNSDSGTHTVTVSVSDGTLSDTRSMTITVNDVNSAQNFLTDPGFESGGTGWQAIRGARSIVTIESYSGAASLQILFHDTVLRNVFQDISVTEGLIYDASGWTKTNGISGTGALIRILWRDSTGTTLRTDIIGALTGTHDWTQMTGSNSAPASAVIARFEVSSAAEPDSSGTAWFDDLSFTLNNQQNRPPVLDPIADITVNEDDTITLSPTATDADGDTLTFDFSGWMTSSHYTTDFTDAGTYTVTVTVSDGILTHSQDVTITVVDVNINNAPVLSPITNISVNEGEIVVLTPTATDADGDTLTFSYSGWMTSSHYTTDFTDAGTYTVTVTVSDGILTDLQDVTITVVDVNINNAPVLSPITDILVNEGEIVVLTPTATDADGDTLTVSYSGWMTSSHYTTDFTDSGTYTATITVSDGILVDMQDVSITVLNTNRAPVLGPISDITVNEGDVITLSPTATDADGDTLAFNYSGWMTSNRYISNNSDSGTHTVTVSVSDGTLSDTRNMTITVNDVNSAQNLLTDPGFESGGTGWQAIRGARSIVTIESYSGTASLQILFQYVFQDVSVTEGRIYDASGWIKTNELSGTGALIRILWQDSTGTTLRTDIIGTLITGTQDWTQMTGSNSAPASAVIARFEVLRSVAGPNSIGTAWFDDLSFTLNNQQNRPPVLDPIADITVDEGDTITLNPTATDADGDILTYTYAGLMTSNVYTTNFLDVGTRTVTVTVSDGISTDYQDVVITVVNLDAPVLDPIADLTVNIGETITLNPTAIDPNGDFLIYTYTGWMTSNTYTTNYLDVGIHTVTVTASDGMFTDSQDVMITVIDVFQLTVSWDANTESDLAGYKVYYGTSSRKYDSHIDVSNKTTHTLSNLAKGVTHYIAVTAYDFSGNESTFSNELTHYVPPL